MKRTNKKKSITPKKLQKQIERFEKENPDIRQAMRTLDMTLEQYQQTLRSLEPVKTYTSSSTKVPE